jgi:DHHC palmitoyltransferase
MQDEEAGEGGWFWNEQVASFRPPGALYCRECGVLIQEYDHLCPWTGTGIGRDKYVVVSSEISLAVPPSENLTYLFCLKTSMCAFKSFVVSVNVLCYLSIGILIWGLLSGLAS